MKSRTTVLLVATCVMLAGSVLFFNQAPNAVSHPANKSTQTTNPGIEKKTARENSFELTDEQILDQTFGPAKPEAPAVNPLLADFRSKHPGKTMRSLIGDPSLKPKLDKLLQRMTKNPAQFKMVIESMAFATKAQRINGSANNRFTLNLDKLKLNEQQAERYISAILSDDADSFTKTLAAVVNESAAVMALNPDTTPPSSKK